MKLVSPRAMWSVCRERSKLLCLDVGTSKIGVAISDENRYVSITRNVNKRNERNHTRKKKPDAGQRLIR